MSVDLALYNCVANKLHRGNAEDARKENAGLENAASKCRGGICRTGKLMREKEKYGTPHSSCGHAQQLLRCFEIINTVAHAELQYPAER